MFSRSSACGGKFAAAALVEQDDAVGVGIEEAAVDGTGGAAGAAVNEDHGRTVRVARFLDVDAVDAGVQSPGLARLDRGVAGAPRPSATTMS